MDLKYNTNISKDRYWINKINFLCYTFLCFGLPSCVLGRRKKIGLGFHKDDRVMTIIKFQSGIRINNWR